MKSPLWLRCLFSTLIISAVAGAATFTVPLDVETIQAAIDSAADGDLILVLPGEYRENIDFTGKKVVLLAPAGPLFTSIDGGGEGPCVTMANGEDLSTMLVNFKLTGGAADDGEYGGALRIEGAMPIIMFNEITGNRAEGGGGAIAAMGISAPVIYRNSIYLNETAGQGGAIYISASAPQIINNTLVSNSSEGEGGAVYATIGIGAQLVNNIIVDNASGRGAAITAGFLTRLAADYNDVWDNEDGDYENVDAGDGSISADPNFLSADENVYLITEDSPCIDAGDPDLPGDLDGSIADIGCWPFLHLPPLEPLAVSLQELAFGYVPVGEESTLTLTIRNPNELAVTAALLPMSLSPFTAADSLVTLEGNSETGVDINFHPDGERDFTDTLRLLAAAEMVVFDTLSLPYPLGLTSVALTGSATPNHIVVGEPLPHSSRLAQAYPNPFNSSLHIRLGEFGAHPTQGEVLTITGSRVAGLAFTPGARAAIWTPEGLPAGAYILQIHFGDRRNSVLVQYVK